MNDEKTMSVNAQRNRRLSEALRERTQSKIRESLKSAYGVDLNDKTKFDFEAPFFSMKSFRESAYKVAAAKLSEAQSESVFGALLRGGINNIAMNWYQTVPTDKEAIVQMTTSSHAVEPYALLARGAVPRLVSRGTQFPEVKQSGPTDIQLQNYKFGGITAFERELFDDDQTGLIMDRAKDIGPNMAILEDAWTFQRFIGTAGTFGGDVIPASETYPSGVWSTSLVGGGKNRLSPYKTFSTDDLMNAHIVAMNQVDVAGNKLLTNPDTLLININLQFAAQTVMNGAFYVGTNAIKIGGSSGTATNVGGVYSGNVLKGLYNIVTSRFLPAGAWAIGQAGRGMVFQQRDGLEIIQENPTSGNAFSVDEFRFRARARWNVDWIDPRFWVLGNDGSV